MSETGAQRKIQIQIRRDVEGYFIYTDRIWPGRFFVECFCFTLWGARWKARRMRRLEDEHAYGVVETL